MKKTIIIFAGIILCFLSCVKREYPRTVNVHLLQAETNYFADDSIQRLDGYYPLRVYLFFSVHNMYDDSLYFPVRGRYDTLKESTVKMTGHTAHLLSMQGRDFVSPFDSTTMFLIINLDDVPRPDIFPMLHNFIKDMNPIYIKAEADSVLSKYAMPDTVIFNIDRNIELRFRDEESLGVDDYWIL